MISKQEDNTADHVYLNLTMQVPTDPTINSYATFDVSLNQPFLDKTSDYDMSIIRFSVPGTAIPITIFPVIDTGAQPYNQSNLIFTLVFNNIAYSRPVIFTPLSSRTIPTYYNQYDKYYFMYSYQHMLDLFNTTLSLLVSDVNSNNGTAYVSPYFYFDPKTNRIQFFMPTNYVTTLQVCINFFIYNYIQGFSYNYVKFSSVFTSSYLNNVLQPNTTNAVANANYIFVTTNNNTLQTNAYIIPGTTSPSNFLLFIEQYSMISYWNSFRTLIFQSTTMPIVNEQGFIANKITNTSIPTNTPIVTDFEPILNNPGDCRQELQYYPQGPYRLVGMTGYSQLKSLSIQISWQTQFGQVIPLDLVPGSNAATVKILFKKKKVHGGN